MSFITRFDYQNAVRKTLRTPEEINATPYTGRETRAYAESMSRGLAEAAQQREEEARWDAEMKASRDMMDAWAQANSIASLIGAGTVAATGISGYANQAQADKDAAAAKAEATERRALGDRALRAERENSAMQRNELAKQEDEDRKQRLAEENILYRLGRLPSTATINYLPPGA